MKTKNPSNIKKIVFFIGYDWDVHNQIDLYVAQAARLSNFNLSIIGIFCNGLNRHLHNTCEAVKDVPKSDDISSFCDRCLQNKISKFSNVFDSYDYLFVDDAELQN